MRTNINVELFKRYAPAKKLEMIDSLNSDDLMNISTSTFERIVKEAGEKPWKVQRSSNKRLRIRNSLQKGNNWNSWIEDISLYKGKLYLGVYLQYENTDTSDETTAATFFRCGETRIGVKRSDRYGNDRTYYAVYDEDDKSEVARSILKEYVYTKYHEKLKAQ